MTLRVVLTDIEGTTTALSFVRDTLFPFARAQLADFLLTHADTTEVRAACTAARDAEPHDTPLSTLHAWMDADLKQTALKTLQGRIWQAGYASGALRGHVWPDAVEGLQRIAASGLRLAVFSSGSVAAQQLLFRYSIVGDLSALFCAWFDTHVGAKREVQSYQTIAGTLGVRADEILFLSDVPAELDAAALSGMHTCCIERGEAGIPTAHAHHRARDFSQLDLSTWCAEPGAALRSSKPVAPNR